MTSPDTASAKMTIAIGHYKHQQQPFQFNSIRQRNQFIPSNFQHQGSWPTANHLKALGQLKVEYKKKHHALPYKGNRNNYNASTCKGREEPSIRNAKLHDDAKNCASSSKTPKLTGHNPTLPITISLVNHVIDVYAVLDCAIELTNLKS